jgi:hypothetical protein
MSIQVYLGAGALSGALLGGTIGYTLHQQKTGLISSTTDVAMVEGTHAKLLAEIRALDYDASVTVGELLAYESHHPEALQHCLQAVKDLLDLHNNVADGMMSIRPGLMRTAASYAERATDHAGLLRDSCPAARQYEFDSKAEQVIEMLKQKTDNVHQDVKAKVF